MAAIFNSGLVDTVSVAPVTATVNASGTVSRGAGTAVTAAARLGLLRLKEGQPESSGKTRVFRRSVLIKYTASLSGVTTAYILTHGSDQYEILSWIVQRDKPGNAHHISALLQIEK